MFRLTTVNHVEIKKGFRNVLCLPTVNGVNHGISKDRHIFSFLTADWGTWVNRTECSKWKEKVLHMERKLFSVYNVSTIFVTYYSLSKHFEAAAFEKINKEQWGGSVVEC